MEINYSNKRYSMIIAGILVTYILTVFVAFTLGVGSSNNFSDNSDQGLRPMSSEPLYMLETNKSEDILDSSIKTKGDHGDVSVDQTYTIEDLTVGEAADVQFYDTNIDEEPLPICINPDWALDKWIAFKTKGGYVPADVLGMVEIQQCGSRVINPCNGMWVGWGLTATINDDYWICTSDPCECWHIYNITFDTSCDNWICLDSTPDQCSSGCDKLVDFVFDTHWVGCEFDYILALENRVPGIPNSRI
jgi:hypothetical protein